MSGILTQDSSFPDSRLLDGVRFRLLSNFFRKVGTTVLNTTEHCRDAQKGHQVLSPRSFCKIDTVGLLHVPRCPNVMNGMVKFTITWLSFDTTRYANREIEAKCFPLWRRGACQCSSVWKRTLSLMPIIKTGTDSQELQEKRYLSHEGKKLIYYAVIVGSEM